MSWSFFRAPDLPSHVWRVPGNCGTWGGGSVQFVSPRSSSALLSAPCASPGLFSSFRRKRVFRTGWVRSRWEEKRAAGETPALPGAAGDALVCSVRFARITFPGPSTATENGTRPTSYEVAERKRLGPVQFVSPKTGFSLQRAAWEDQNTIMHGNFPITSFRLFSRLATRPQGGACVPPPGFVGVGASGRKPRTGRCGRLEARQTVFRSHPVREIAAAFAPAPEHAMIFTPAFAGGRID